MKFTSCGIFSNSSAIECIYNGVVTPNDFTGNGAPEYQLVLARKDFMPALQQMEIIWDGKDVMRV